MQFDFTRTFYIAFCRNGFWVTKLNAGQPKVATLLSIRKDPASNLDSGPATLSDVLRGLSQSL
jgi:hypothetical protein